MDKDVKLSYDDITLIPERITGIYSRSMCDPYDENEMLPIFTAPMNTVVDNYNWTEFLRNKINVVIPRTVDISTRIRILDDFRTTDSFDRMEDASNLPPVFVAFSMEETKKMLIDEYQANYVEFYITWRRMIDHVKEHNSKIYICIDLANGHMQILINLVKLIKKKYGDRVVIMTGNIANPMTILDYAEAGVDFARFSIGTGSGCLTSSQSSIHYPIFSLLKEAYEIKKANGLNIKIIADGGIKGYRDIQKALVYADYVMIGGLFNKCIESAGETTYGRSWIDLFGYKVRNRIVDFFRMGKVVPPIKYNRLIDKVKSGYLELNKKFYGMSTKIAQKELGAKYLKTSEGKIITNNVEYSLKGWVENETSYLRSAMSYVNATNLDEYKESQWVRINKISYNK